MRAMAKKKSKKPDNVIAQNKRASFDYHLLENFEAGIALSGWEVKSLRMGKADLADSYVLMKDGEAFLLGAHIIPLDTASTHFVTDPTRTRKLLAHRKEIDRLVGMVERKGYTLVALSAYWIRGRAKLKIGIAKGKKAHDKRDSQKDKDWNRQKQRIVRDNVKQ